MMYQGFAADYEASSSRCSSASPAGDSLTYYPSPADSFSSMGSPVNAQDFCTDLAASSANFVPTVTAISTSPDLQWMVQPTLISSVAPSQARTHPYGLQTPQPGPYSRTGIVKGSGSRGQSIGRRGKVEQLTPEEEEKRRIRRERNKMAAAKCRNRRRELTDTLQAETDQLEEEKSALQAEIAHLLKEKEKLEFILAAHRPACKIPGAEEDEEDALPSLAMEDLLPGEGSPEEEHPHPREARAGGEGPAGASALEALEEEEEEEAFALPLLHQEPPSSSSSLKAEPLEALFPLPSSSSGSSLPGLRRVPDVDLSGGSSSSFYAADWEPLGPASSGLLGPAPELEPLCTPVVACTPSFPYTSSAFVFTFPAPAAENEASSNTFPTCAAAHRKGSTSNEPSSDSLSSPTLLAL